MRISHAGTGVAMLGSGVALYYLVADATGVGEAVGCALVMAVALPFGVAIGWTGSVSMRVTGRGLLALGRAWAVIPRELWCVGVVLGRAVRRRPAAEAGEIKAVPFRFGAFEPTDIGRRAAVDAGLSLAPNGFVLGMDHGRDTLLLHQLAPRPVGGDREWPA